MALMKKLDVMFSILIGFVATLVTCTFINNNIIGELPAIRLAGQTPPGVDYWGYLLPWLRQVSYSLPCQITVIWQNFVVDILIWAVIAYAILNAIKLLVLMVKKGIHYLQKF